MKTTSWLLGLSVSATAVTAVIQGCTSEQVAADMPADGTWEPAFLSPDEVDLVAELCETILPKTNTPGAKDVLVHRYVDIMLKDHYQPREQREFKRGLIDVNTRATDSFGQNFLLCHEDQRKQLLEALEVDAHTAQDAGYELAKRPFFLTLKELTYIGYFTSEAVGEQVLNYDPVPGQYDGCVPLNDIGNVWSL